SAGRCPSRVLPTCWWASSFTLSSAPRSSSTSTDLQPCAARLTRNQRTQPAASSVDRTLRSSPLPSAAISADPTATPSATSATVWAVSLFDTPKPTTTLVAPAALVRATNSPTSAATAARAPVTPVTLTAYTKPELALVTRFRRSVVDVG